jgi:hypothetical protein
MWRQPQEWIGALSTVLIDSRATALITSDASKN